MKKNKLPSIMEHVDITDLVDTVVVRELGGLINVSFECKEEGKQVVIDESALSKLNEILTEKTKELTMSENTLKYVEEFSAKMLSEFHRNGLAVIDEIPDTPDDPYKGVRYKYVRN